MNYEMQKYPQVKITTKDFRTDIFIDDFHCHHVTGISANWDNVGRMATITVSMLAEVEIDAESAVLLKLDNTNSYKNEEIKTGDTVKTDNIAEGVVTRIDGDQLFVDVYGSEVSGLITDFHKVR